MVVLMIVFQLSLKSLKGYMDTEKAWKAKGKINYKKTNTENQMLFLGDLYTL